MYFLSELHKNSILTGSVDSYCLVCDSYLRSEDDAFTHTEKPIHKKNMGAATYLEKFVDDRIIKVKKGYYCTFCNVLLSTSTKVGLHISNTNHQEQKGAQMLSRVGDHIVLLDEVAITQDSWHGMSENTCVICNTEFEKNDIHRSEKIHILKLIQSKCEFGEKYVYRKVDKESFFCLICGSVFAISDKPYHHQSIKHIIFYNDGKELKNNIPTVPQVQAKNTTKVVSLNLENDTKDNEIDFIKSQQAAAKPDEATPNQTNMRATEPTKPIDSEKTETIKAKTDIVIAKNTKVVDDIKTKAEDKVTQDSAKEPVSNTSKEDDFIDSVSKLINTKNENPEISEYLHVSNYIIQNEACEMCCVLCDVIFIKEKDVEVHITDDLHHQMMLKKHKETLYKKEHNGAQINETFPADNLIQYRGKIYLDQSVNPTTCATTAHRLEGKVTVPEQRQLITATPLDIQSKIINQNQDSDISSDEDEDYKTKILDNVDKFQENDITIDVTSERAYCKQCDEDLLFNQVALLRHIEEKKHINNSNSNIEQIKVKSQTISYAQENFIVISNDGAICKMCNIEVSKNKEDIVEHVNSRYHKYKVDSSDKDDLPQKIPLMEFMETFIKLESQMSQEIVVNNKFLLKYYSFHCVIQEQEKYKCVLCQENFMKELPEQLIHHLNSVDHKIKMGLCKVIRFSDEFIRELAPGLFHCGYCNKVLEEVFDAHFRLAAHKTQKRQAAWNLQRCYSIIKNARSQQPDQRSRSDYNQQNLLSFPRSMRSQLMSPEFWSVSERSSSSPEDPDRPSSPVTQSS